jgi:hypothetical protein
MGQRSASRATFNMYDGGRSEKRGCTEALGKAIMVRHRASGLHGANSVEHVERYACSFPVADQTAGGLSSVLH